MEWWDAMKYIIDTVQPIYKFLRFADQDKKPNMCEVVMAYQNMKQELRSLFGTNISTLKEYIEVVDERMGDVFIGMYVLRIRSPRIAARSMMVMMVTVLILMLEVVVVVLTLLLLVVVVLVVFVSQVYIAHINRHIFLTMSIDY